MSNLLENDLMPGQETSQPPMVINLQALVLCNRNLTAMIRKTKDPATRNKLKRIRQANTQIILNKPYA